MKYADVIVPLAVEGMYTYAVPDELEVLVKEGTLVLLAFAGNKKYTALVARIHSKKPEHYEVRPIDGIAEEKVSFSKIHLTFISWVSHYYMAALGEVLKAALPVMLRLESHTSIVLTDKEMEMQGLSKHEQMCLNLLRPGESLSLKEIEKLLKLKNGLPIIKKLLTKNYIQVKEVVDDAFQEKTIQVVTPVKNFSEEEIASFLQQLKRAPVQYRTFFRWIEGGCKIWEKSIFLKEMEVDAVVLKKLCEKQIFKIEKQSWGRNPEAEKEVALNMLTPDQERVFHSILDEFREKRCVLLEGVTSSGKTEVYIHLIKKYMEEGRQVLYLLPEIALTIQIVHRLKMVFGEQVGVYHSGMSDAVRASLWRKQCSDSPYRLILGVRSSVFLPFSALGLIIVDEEHDLSYKQKEPAPRYQGRDAAIMLGQLYGARVLLGSATPSFESYQHALTGKYGWVQLKQRYGGVQMPEVKLVDLKEFRRKKLMEGSLSPTLIQEMNRVLAEKKQVILFQNRRGYSVYVQCEVCGSIPKCKHCDVSLTYYKQRNRLICRYCGNQTEVDACCPDCGGQYKERTPGTERIEEEVARLFPKSRVARMDLEVINSKSRSRRLIEEFEQGKIDILIGTQMVTKGLDFEHVKLVGVLDADQMIHYPDFRAEERAYAMLLQVSGRCGRRNERGKVIIQTADVKNRVFSMLLKRDFSTFFSQLMMERRSFGYPPAGRMISIEIRHKDNLVLRNAANALVCQLRGRMGNSICGPAVPEVGRIRGFYRLVIVVKMNLSISCSGVKSFLHTEFAQLRVDKKFTGIRIYCDVDP